MQTSGAASQEPTMNQSVTSQAEESEEDEHFKLAVNLCLERFGSSDQREVDFPSCFSGTERAYIHRTAQSLGYVSKSKEKGPKHLIVWKRESGDKTSTALPISQKSLQFIQSLFHRFPTRYKEDMDIQFNTESGTYLPVQTDNSRDKFRPTGFLHGSHPLVPNKRNPSELDSFRCSLPVHGYQEEIVQLVRTNRVVMVVGETGSGKTTQIPQFLLDDCHVRREACRIFCTQPRRLAVISLAERVAAERGESVGQTVGYHIRLENRISPKTLLTFCTHGVLLRTLMTGDSSLKTVTHVVMDDVDERDGLTDVLLTKMRSILQQIPTLKLILSSAALNVDLFHQYFGSCPVIHIKGRQFEVQELFLEDVLKLTGFNIQDEDETSRKEKQQTCLTEWCKAAEKQRSPESVPDFLQDGSPLDREDSGIITRQTESDSEQLEQEMDLCISNSFFSEDLDSFNRLFDLILYKNVHVDYSHSEMGATPLMVAASRGLVMQMEQLLIMGADIAIKATNGWTALDFARSCQHPDAVDLLQASFPLRELSVLEEECEHSELSSEEQELDLIVDLLHYICSTTRDGSVLIFVADYSHIVSLKYRIQREDQRFVTIAERFHMFSVYSDSQTLDQKTVMDASPPGVRKIILSTNIAETSLTISDVMFVIDSGKVKETSFDSVSHVSVLKTVWISKASALQRKGRAGRSRPGICFHLFSRHRLNNMVDFKVPQLLQMPLQGLCLQTKLLVPSSCPVSDFLSKAPQPPPADAVTKTVHRLKAIDAMDQDEDLTYLGCYLADISIEPHLGKMVLSSVALKCLDPVLTIVCSLAYRDPFVLPEQGREKSAALQCRKRFSSCSLSDHMALLRAFQAWQRARREGGEKSFCEKNFLSQSTMEMIFDLRVQLLGQLRAIGFVRPRGSSNIHELNQNSENWAVVKAALVAGTYPNMVHIDQDASASSSTDRKVHFHPTSVLNQFREINSVKSGEVFPTNWLIYDEMCRGKRKATVRCCSLVTPITVAVFAGRAMLPGSPVLEYSVPRAAGSSRSERRHDDSDSDSDTEDMAEMSVDKWLSFHCDPEAAGLVFKMKQMWQSLFVKRIRWPSKVYTQREETILQILVSVLTEEERVSGLQQPTGIGQRPWPMTLGDLSLTPVNSSSSSSSTPDRSPAASSLVQRRTLSRDDASLPTRRLSDDLWTSCSLTSSAPCTSEKALTEDEQQPTGIIPWTL